MTLVDLGSPETPSLDKRDAVKTANQSLFTFSRVIQALARQDSRVPYRSVGQAWLRLRVAAVQATHWRVCGLWLDRDSKLTRLIADTLGGYCNTTLIACMSPSQLKEEETMNTIRYSQLSRRILNKPQVNVALLLQRYVRGSQWRNP